MSYQVLARKWRPRSFSTLVGQEHVVRALTHALEQNRLHHAYLFTGTRGVGKTTLARILAKALNCETGVTPEPCGKCSACQEIDAGRFVDLLEVDAATNTKVDEMRQLLENAVYAPTRGRYKVYVIDEVHMLSTSAFNAMLKTLEEPPEHIKFILATTDPQKIPVTVLSRCLQFNLKQMAPAAIVKHLERVASEEKLIVEPAALALLAQSARGSMRDALSLFDQAIAYSAGNVTEEAVRAMLGTVDRSYLFQLLDALAKSDAQAMLAIADEMEGRSIAFDNALQELGALLHRIALAQVAPSALDESLPEHDLVVALAQAFDPEEIQLHYQIALHGRQDLPLAPDEYAGFTMTLMRMLAFRPGSAGEGEPRSSSPSRAASAANSTTKTTAAAPARSGATTRELSAPSNANGPAESFNGDWPALVRVLKVTGLARQLAERSELAAHSENRIELQLPKASKHLGERAFVDKLKTALAEHFGRPVALSITLGEVSGKTVAAENQDKQRAREEQAEASIGTDPFVQALVESFDGTVDSIKPIN